jgi:hypothetical protein
MDRPVRRPVGPLMHRICSPSASSSDTGEVAYVSVPGMGYAKTRPCLVLGAAGSDVALLPLSSDTWNPRLNPSVYFNDGVSFAVLDRVFTLPASSVVTSSKRQISGRALRACIASLRAGVESGRLQLPVRVADVALRVDGARRSASHYNRLTFKSWNNRS